MTLNAISELGRIFATQKTAYQRNSFPSFADRLAWLESLRGVCSTVHSGLTHALAEDFGTHEPSIGTLWELGGVLERRRHAKERLATWMQPSSRDPGPLHGDARCYVQFQPKGVIGNMAPWNFPVDLTLGPLVEMLAAGNRVIVKPSELAPACAELVRSAIVQHFDETIVAVVTGHEALSERFASLPWDHLMYTGNPTVAKLIMAKAAQHLTPLTLELGGKSPTIIAEDRVTKETIAEILAVKAVKAGQVCINTDYVLAPRAALGRVVELVQTTWAEMFPKYVGTPGATGLINDRHFQRIVGYIEEARKKGSRVIALNGEEPDPKLRQVPLTLIVDPEEELRLMQEEIFGPILPVIPYDSLDDAIRYVNARSKPLALYVFTQDARTAEKVLSTTSSGGACVNAVAVHGSIPDLPFGGISQSGMGHHHGHDGFVEFSHARAVFHRGPSNPCAPRGASCSRA